GIQAHSLVPRVYIPGGNNKTRPSLNFWRWPGHRAFHATTVMVGHLNYASRAFTGRDDNSAVANPIVDLRRTRRPHTCVIRCLGLGALSGIPSEIAVVN